MLLHIILALAISNMDITRKQYGMNMYPENFIATKIYFLTANTSAYSILRTQSHLEVKVVEVMNRIGRGQGGDGQGRVGVTVSHQLSRGKALAHVFQAFDKPLLLTVGSKMRILAILQTLESYKLKLVDNDLFSLIILIAIGNQLF